MNIEEIEASEVRILFDGDLRETRDIDPGDSKVEVVLTLHNTGEYCIEMIAEGNLPEEMEELAQQDSLEISPPKAHAAWDVTVEPPKRRLGPADVWNLIGNALVLRELVSIIHNRWSRIRGHFEQSSSEEAIEEDEEVNMTLDEFREE